MMENQRVRMTKKMLKDGLIRLIKKDSIHKLSVKEICAEAEINRTTFYKYYGCPYDLFEELQNDVLTQINDCFNAQSSNDVNTQITKALDFVCENADVCRLLLNNSPDYELPEKLIALQFFKHQIAERLDGKYNDEVLSYIYSFVIHGGYSIIRKWINKDEREPAEEITRLLDMTIIKALA